MLKFEQADLSDQGPIRENNEDFILYHQPTDPELDIRRGCLFVVADGVGGNRAGEVASSQAAQALSKAYYGSRASRPANALREAFKQANLHVCDLSHSNPEYRRMETTLSALVLTGNQALVGHIGDTRIYRVRDERIEQLTTDHSEVGELVRMRLISPDEARHHPRRNIITRSIGSDLFIQVDFYNYEVQPGDSFLLCSDGLWEPVEDLEIARIVSSNSADEACRQLIELSLLRESGDNMSVQVIKILELGLASPDLTQNKNGLLHKIASRVFGN